MLILGIESSCDETGVALVDGQGQLLADALHTQIPVHQAYGGVVPELASRDHVQRVLPLIATVLAQANSSIDAIDAVAYTAGPGLAGALLVGASVAQGLAYVRGCPVWPVHHLEAHLLSPLLALPAPDFPFVALLVSGGHTLLARVDEVGCYTLLGDTLDDAAGEAFDKTAKLLGLPYPGGPALAALAEHGDPTAYPLPRPLLHSADCMFSFSGLKTAVATLLRRLGPLTPQQRHDVAASAQAAIVAVLVKKSVKALKAQNLQRLVVAGGVSANTELRASLQTSLAAMPASSGKAEVFFPPQRFCTDNGVMIAFAAALRHQRGFFENQPEVFRQRGQAFTVHPRWSLFADAAVQSSFLHPG